MATSLLTFACEQQFYGTQETFETAPAAHQAKSTVKNQWMLPLVNIL